jgi:hypothetical protein
MAFVADGFMPVTYHVLIRFGEWEKILDEPEPEDFSPRQPGALAICTSARAEQPRPV